MMPDRVKCVTCGKLMYDDECGYNEIGPACARCLKPHIFSKRLSA